MGDAFKCIFDRVSEVVHGVDAPLVTGSVMRQVIDPVDNWVSHVEVARSEVDLGTESHLSVLKFAGSHSLKQIKAFFDGSVTVGALCRSLCIASHVAHLFGSKLADVSETLFDKLNGITVHLLEIIGSIEESVIPVVAEPVDVFLDSLNEFLILFGGVCIIHSEVAETAVFLGCAEVDLQSFSVADVKIAVRFGRKSGVDLFTVDSSAFFEFFVDYLLNKILAFCHNEHS